MASQKMAFFFTVDGKFPRNAFACEKRLFGAIDTESDHFAKTGSGQTEGKLRKKVFLAPVDRPAETRVFSTCFHLSHMFVPSLPWQLFSFLVLALTYINHYYILFILFYITWWRKTDDDDDDVVSAPRWPDPRAETTRRRGARSGPETLGRDPSRAAQQRERGGGGSTSHVMRSLS